MVSGGGVDALECACMSRGQVMLDQPAPAPTMASVDREGTRLDPTMPSTEELPAHGAGTVRGAGAPGPRHCGRRTPVLTGGIQQRARPDDNHAITSIGTRPMPPSVLLDLLFAAKGMRTW